MPIYTKTGDKGETSLYGGTRISKAAIRVEVYGTVDELNSVLGVAVSFLREDKKTEDLVMFLEEIQMELFDIGANLANPKAPPIKNLSFVILSFEKKIDGLTETLPELHNFIMPGGGKAGSFLHQARTICRRAERRVIALSNEDAIDLEIVRYLNRLSDVLFTCARFANIVQGEKEIIWKR